MAGGSEVAGERRPAAGSLRPRNPPLRSEITPDFGPGPKVQLEDRTGKLLRAGLNSRPDGESMAGVRIGPGADPNPTA